MGSELLLYSKITSVCKIYDISVWQLVEKHKLGLNEIFSEKLILVSEEPCYIMQIDLDASNPV